MEPTGRALAAAQRAWLAVLHAALALPFLVVKSCDDGAVEALTGVGYYVSPERWGLLVVLVAIVGALAAFPWRGARTARAAATLGLRAWTAALGALLAIFGPFLVFLFESPEPKVGWWIHGVGWALTALGYLSATAAVLLRGGPGVPPPDGAVAPRAPERPVLFALLAAPPAAVALRAVLAPDDLPAPALHETVLALTVGYAVCVPLVLAGLALVRARRAGEDIRLPAVGWWAATACTLLAHVAAALGE